MKKSKIIKSVIMFSTIISICLVSILPFNIFNLSAINNNTFTFKNSLYDEYIELNNTRNSTKSISKFNENIFTYNSINIEGIKSKDETGTIGQISKDNTGDYIYAEISKSTNNILLALNNHNYLFIMEGENIYMIDETGKKTTISEMIYHTSPKFDSYENIQEIEPIQTLAWSQEYGPFYKTNKSLVTVLSVISAATGLCSCLHPILGTISLITGVGSVGLDILKTLYIKYYQQMDGTKVKERQLWYENPDYTGYIKSRTITFDSVRPGY